MTREEFAQKWQPAGYKGQEFRDDFAVVFANTTPGPEGQPGWVRCTDPIFAQFLSECMDILGTKGMDYTVGQMEKDRLYNFRTAGQLLGLPMRHTWFIYFYKHFTSIAKWAKDGKEGSEPIRGRFHDAVNYLLLGVRIILEEQAAARAGTRMPPSEDVAYETAHAGA